MSGDSLFVLDIPTAMARSLLLELDIVNGMGGALLLELANALALDAAWTPAAYIALLPSN